MRWHPKWVTPAKKSGDNVAMTASFVIHGGAFHRIAMVRVALRFATGLLILCVAPWAIAQEPARPPCESAPQPAYAAPGAAPNVRVLNEAALKTWRPPACTGWNALPSGAVVALAGSFSVADPQGLLQRLGEVSRLRGMRYWSVSDRNWRTLISDAYALTRRDSGVRRPDFSAGELQSGQDFYFAQSDTRSTGDVIYRIRVREFSPDRLVVESENVSPVRALLLTLFAPGELRAVYFFERLDGQRWGYYALNAALGRSTSGNEASLVNRAAAYHRHFTGVATDGAPPLAP